MTDKFSNEKEAVSYALGLIMATNLKKQGFDEVDATALSKGFSTAVYGGIKEMSLEQADQMIQQYLGKKQSEKFAGAKDAGIAFLAENKKKAGVTTTDSGLQYEVLTEGSGASPKASDTVTVHYHGSLTTGEVFDSSVERGQPASFPLNGVIPGWTEGVQLMKVGSKFRFTIPYALAYGERGAGNDIPPFATLVFDVELLSIA